MGHFFFGGRPPRGSCVSPPEKPFGLLGAQGFLASFWKMACFSKSVHFIMHIAFEKNIYFPD